ncbi:MAG: MBL fold metallo-hydrolase [Acidimicrobiia bacterium]|nr:MBL fold metallo-hydrolase [Acidimicrobiia bacterium]MDH3462871.1 MBL fold metallo-hydrolase [Acidimicrobiia bacterium]
MFDQLDEGIFRRRYASLDLNIGVVIGDDGILIIDSRASHQQGEELRQELRQLTGKRVGWVVNTHWHWDHTFGNSRFPEAEIWGHERSRRALAERGAEMKVGAKKWIPADYHPLIDKVEILPPTNVFAEQASIRIGRQVDLRYHGLGHTDADITVTVAESQVAFMGDLIEEGAPPGFGDSYPTHWAATLRRILPGLAGVVVPGHGDVVDASFVEGQVQELELVATLAKQVAAGELGVEEGIGAGPYPPEVMRSALERATVAI